MTKKPRTEREIVEELQRRADSQRRLSVDFGPEPGPFVLPKCGPKIGLALAGADTVVLVLELEGRNQQVEIPLAVQALGPLGDMIQILRRQHGIDQTKQ